MRFQFCRIFCCVPLLSVAHVLRAADTALPLVSPMFGDNMVLQRDKPNTIWGWAALAEKIKIEIAGRIASAVADKTGRWQTQFVPPKTGGPYALKISGIAIALDTGDADNIHPAEKKPVGERLALVALANEYGKKISFAGPTFKKSERAGGAMKIYFAHTDGGLVAKNGALKEFSIAGADPVWHWADAKIDGDCVVVSSLEVSSPVAVRYA